MPRESAIVRAERLLSQEVGTIHKDWGGRIPVLMAYPNAYSVGMSNLGLHAVYALFNRYPDFVCERTFYDSSGIALESKRALSEFPVAAFSFSFEEDYLRAVEMLRRAGIPLWASERDERHPLLLAGGPAVTANSEPLAPFFDAFALGEGEVLIPPLVEIFRQGLAGPREALLEWLARIPGVYVPRFYDVGYRADGTIAAISPRPGFPYPLARQGALDLDAFPIGSAILTPNTEFGDMYLMEVARGCARGCQFCLAGQIYRPFRARSPGVLLAQASEGLRHRKRLGLVGTAVFDYPQLGELLGGLEELGARISTSSLRLDALSPELLGALKRGGEEAITLAPEAGSFRLRRFLGKPFTDEAIVQAAAQVEAEGFPELKLYFMLGLPGEEEADIEALASLAKKLRGVFSHRLIVQVSPFVPKAQTPLERCPMAFRKVLAERVAYLKGELARMDIRVRSESLRWAEVQAILARGDRRLAEVLALQEGRSLALWQEALASARVDPGFYLDRERPPEERLPWEVGAGSPQIW